MKLSDVAPYFEEGPTRREPDGLIITVMVKLDTPRKVLAFAWDMALTNSRLSWWRRLSVFIVLLFWGLGQLFTRRP